MRCLISCITENNPLCCFQHTSEKNISPRTLQVQRSQRIYNSKEPTGLVTEGDLLYESGDGFTLQINQGKKEEKKKNQCGEKKGIYIQFL